MSDEAPASIVSFKKRSNNRNTIRKRPASPPPAPKEESSEDEFISDDSGDEGRDPAMPRAKKAKWSGGITEGTRRERKVEKEDVGVMYEGNRSKTVTKTNDATRENTESVLDAEYLLGKKAASLAPTDTEDGLYRGQAGYKPLITPNPDRATSKFTAKGPIKAPTNIRTVTVIDYQPDVCKDYKQTGFCGYGDSCKFLHDRGDYKAGWQLDREWEDVQKKKKVGGESGTTSDDKKKEEEEVEGIPFVCLICRKDYKNPIVTKCGHYFCEGCALQRYRKNATCLQCGAGTQGIFNVAKDFKKKLEERSRRQEEREQGKDEDGEEGVGEVEIEFGGGPE
ncbi:Phosphatidylinositol (PI) 3-kinase [Saitoella coloradoensis]